MLSPYAANDFLMALFLKGLIDCNYFTLTASQANDVQVGQGGQASLAVNPRNLSTMQVRAILGIYVGNMGI